MPSSEPVNWQPKSQMPLVAGLIDGIAVDGTFAVLRWAFLAMAG
jgi:hypothetical protein